MTDSSLGPSKVTEVCKKGCAKNHFDVKVVTLSQKIYLTKKQSEVLKTICDAYEQSISQYLQEILVDVMRCDIEEGNFCDALIEKIGCEDNYPPSQSSPGSLAHHSVKNDLDLLKKTADTNVVVT
jgi:hypothetical protein